MGEGPPRARRQFAAMVDAALRHQVGTDLLDGQGKFRRRSHILVKGVDHKLLRESVLLERGSQAWWPGSGLTLTLNSFLAWRRMPEQLVIDGEGGFEDLRFGARCTTGIRGTPPQLDLLALGDRTVLAICGEGPGYLLRRQTRLAPAYHTYPLAADLEGWAGLRQTLKLVPDSFVFVDAAAFLKFAIGLARIFPDRRCILLYLYWEPEIGAELSPFQTHRQEIRRLEDQVGRDRIGFRSLRFADLWQAWEQLHEPLWLPDLLVRLRDRYSVAIR